MPSHTCTPISPESINLARLAGISSANEWLQFSATAAGTRPTSLENWRSCNYAIALSEYSSKADQDPTPLIDAWDAGFKVTLQVVGTQATDSAAYTPSTPLAPAQRNDYMAEFAALTLDVCQGLQTCLGIVHKASVDHWDNDDMEPGHETQPLLSQFDAEQLSRFAIASVGMLARTAQDRIDWLNKMGAGGSK
jgi:hypothetical protein